MGGIAYCNKLEFISTAEGENQKSILTIDCKTLRFDINDSSNDDDAIKAYSKNLSIDHENEEEPGKRYFVVRLSGVTDKKLLQKDEVFQYLSQVAPVPFSPAFSHRKIVKKYLEKRGLEIPEYNIFLNEDHVLKLYSDNIYDSSGNNKITTDKIIDVEFRDVLLNDEVIAVMWFGISKFKKALTLKSNKMAGLRYRQWNIEIGNENNTVDLFKEKEELFILWSEIHTKPGVMKVNARRDAFTFGENSKHLTKKLESICRSDLNKFFRDANYLKNLISKKEALDKEVEMFNKISKTGWKDNKTKEIKKANLLSKTEEAKAAEVTLSKFSSKDDAITKKILDIYKEDIKKFKDSDINEIQEKLIPDNQIKIELEKKVVGNSTTLNVIKEVLDEHLNVLKANTMLKK